MRCRPRRVAPPGTTHGCVASPRAEPLTGFGGERGWLQPVSAVRFIDRPRIRRRVRGPDTERPIHAHTTHTLDRAGLDRTGPDGGHRPHRPPCTAGSPCTWPASPASC
jgi:hypothetical protein